MIKKTYLVSCTSTNLEARKIDFNNPQYVAYVIYTLNQTQGRGSLSREWVCPPNKSLAFTFCTAHRNHKLHQDPRLSLVIAITVVNILRKLLPAELVINWRWPNDIVLQGKKLAGILVEWTADRLIIGIGINLITEPADFPQEFAANTAALNLNPNDERFEQLINHLSNSLFELCLHPPDFTELIKTNLDSFDTGSTILSITDENGNKVFLHNLAINPETGALSGVDNNGNQKVLTSIHSVLYNTL